MVNGVNSTNSNGGSTFATVAAAGTGAALGSALTTKYASPAILNFANNLQTDTFIKSEKVAKAVKTLKVPEMASAVSNFVKKHPTKTAAIGAAILAIGAGLIGNAVTKSHESVSSHQG